jgi:hypothetical protein
MGMTMKFINASMVLEAIVHNIDVLVAENTIPEVMIYRLKEMRLDVMDMRDETLEMAKFPMKDISDTVPPKPEKTLIDVEKPEI